MARYDYSRYKIRIAPDSEKRQGLLAGDVVRRHYTDRKRSVYSLMVVLETGDDQIETTNGIGISPYFIGALLGGDEPCNGELLDFVRVTNLFDDTRSGALYLTASDSDSPYMDVIDAAGMTCSLCYPTAGNGAVDGADSSHYGCMGSSYLDTEYKSQDTDAKRVYRIMRNATVLMGEDVFGFQQNLPVKIGYPQRVVISYKIRGSKRLSDIPLTLEDTDGAHMDGAETIDISPQWQYKLAVITTEYPLQYRSVRWNLAGLLDTGDWVEMGDLNICLQEDIANLSKAVQARVGKISGVVDPLFGVLDGYGAYFQNLYATRNVNIAGTLTAGDENGFASTFYVGRIHRNSFLNSLNPGFLSEVHETADRSPTGIGKTYALPVGETIVECQHEAWAFAHAGQRYCFSFWAYSPEPQTLVLRYGGNEIGRAELNSEWQRHSLVLSIGHSAGKSLSIQMSAPNAFFFSSPQLETGNRATLYQPTDEVLRETDDYGAWFNKGGIGGTIQNPLLRFEDDGSIRSANGSFVINADGTGYFAGGRFRWDKDTIALQGVTLRWEDFDETAQDALLPKSVFITGTDTFHYPDMLTPLAEPAGITLIATENNFMGESRRWDYLSTEGEWKDTGGRTSTFVLAPDSHVWESRDVLTLRYVAILAGKEYTTTFTVSKLYDGKSSYSVYIKADRGTILQNGIGETTLSAYVMRGAEDVTMQIAESSFLWIRQSGDSEDDARWNSEEHRGRSVVISGNDVLRKAVFNCEVNLTTT